MDSSDESLRKTSELRFNDGGVPLEVSVSVVSDIGCRRELNEDFSRYINPADPKRKKDKGALVLVADGMGGHAAGDVASRLAVETIGKWYYDSHKEPQEALIEAFRRANRTVYQKSTADRALHGMGTTCTALVIRDGEAISAHVGDSRMYLVRDENIFLLTEDHSMVMELVRKGLLSREEARHHADRNVILRALGLHADVEIARWENPLPVRINDRFLLCSDGLYDLVEDEEMKEIVRTFGSMDACNRLVSLARTRGGYDNITVALIYLYAADVVGPVDKDTREVPVLIP